MSHLREGLIAMSASHRCGSNTPPSHPTPLCDCDESEGERGSCGILKHVVFSFHFHSRDYIWLKSENPESCIISVWFLIPHASQYPKGRCFNAYLLLFFFFVSRERTFYSRAMECWIKWWFSCTNIERGFQGKKKQFPLHCLSKSPPKQLLLSQRASEALDQYLPWLEAIWCSKCMDPSPLHSPKTGVDFWKLLSDGFTMGKEGGGG